MFHMARYPFAQPTAMSVGDSQVRQVHSVSGGRDSKAAVLTLTCMWISIGLSRYSIYFTVFRFRVFLIVQIDIQYSHIPITPDSS